MGLFCALFLALQAGELNVENFKWTLLRGQNKENKYQIKDGEIEFNFLDPGKGQAWFVGQAEQEITLTGQKFLNFSARSGDGQIHSVFFYIRRELEPKNEASFYSIVEIGPEWRNYSLRLTTVHRTSAGKGAFAYAKGTPNCEIDLSKGGKLLTMQPVVREAAVLSFKNFALTDTGAALDPEMQAVVNEIAGHSRFIPFRFREVIKPDAVAATGFTIVLDTAAGDTEKFAAAELAKYLEKVTGNAFPVNTTSGEKNIHLQLAAGKSGEGFTGEFTDGKNLYLRGDSPRGLIYAVYDFLEKAAGVRWLVPFDYGEVVPANRELKFPLFKDASAPDMSYRRPQYCSFVRQPGSQEHMREVADWAVKNRFNLEMDRITDRRWVEEFYRIRGGGIPFEEMRGHNFHRMIPPKKYFEKHPEYFCFERSTGKWRYEHAQLCTTNPELVTELGKVADDYFQRHPNYPMFPLFQEDGARLWCQCPACLALNPSGSNLASASENNINLINNVLDEIRKRHPGKGIMTYAYGVTTAPPVKVLPRDGICVYYCYAPGDPNLLPWECSAGLNILRWSRLTKGNMVLYTYHHLGPRYAFNNEKALLTAFRFFDILKIQGCNQESFESWAGADAYLQYLGSRMAWNPWFDEEAMRRDYYDKLFDAGGDAMLRNYEMISAILSDKSKWKRMASGTHPYFAPDEIEALNANIRSALDRTAGNERAQRAVQAEADFIRCLAAHSLAMFCGDDYYREPSPEKYRKTRQAIADLKKVCEELIPKRLVSRYFLTLYNGWENRLNESFKRDTEFNQVLQEYNLIKTIGEPWKFKTDPDAAGDKEQWFAREFDDGKWASIKSGKFWEDQGFPNYDGAAWYRITIDIPAGKPCALYFGGADERAWVYLDGKYLDGHHEGDVGLLWQEPFQVDIPEGTPAGKHQLTVKVIDSGGKGGLWRDVILLQKK